MEDPELARAARRAPTRYLAAEVRYAALHEGALHVDDVLTRRTHIAFEDFGPRELAADDVARLLAPVLG